MNHDYETLRIEDKGDGLFVQLAGEIEAHQREIDMLRADLVHVDATLRLFDPQTDPDDIMPRRQHHWPWSG